MLKYDWLKIAEMHVFAKSLAVAAFVMADTPVYWTFLNQNCFWRWKLMYMGNQLIVISDPRPTHPRRLDNLNPNLLPILQLHVEHYQVKLGRSHNSCSEEHPHIPWVVW